MLNIFKDIKKISVFGIAMVSSGLVSGIISHKKRKTPLMKMDIINMVMIKKVTTEPAIIVKRCVN